jgi:hypothetical protein
MNPTPDPAEIVPKKSQGRTLEWLARNPVIGLAGIVASVIAVPPDDFFWRPIGTKPGIVVWDLRNEDHYRQEWTIFGFIPEVPPGAGDRFGAGLRAIAATS